jgi:hypothetical protein
MGRQRLLLDGSLGASYGLADAEPEEGEPERHGVPAKAVSTAARYSLPPSPMASAYRSRPIRRTCSRSASTPIRWVDRWKVA